MAVTSKLEWAKTRWIVVLTEVDDDGAVRAVIRLPLGDWLNLKMVQYAVHLAGETVA